MPALTLVQFISASLSILQAGWKLYQGMKAKANQARLRALGQELDQAYGKLKTLLTPREAMDAASSLSQSHRDILN